MKTTSACPPIEELQRLLRGAASDDSDQPPIRHLDSCTDCQKKLEELAVEGTDLSRVVGELQASEPVATSAYWPALAAVGGEVPAAKAPEPALRRSEIKLTFLQPAGDGAYLGRLAHFDVMRVIGRGGMGLVLEAFDSRLQRNVALKVLDPDLADDDVARKRFCREARAAASITHENVVAVHQVEHSVDGSLPYLVMQLIAGESLEQRLQRERRLPLREVVRIGMQAAQGLAAAHAQGLIHRDIKPGNILLEPTHDQVKLTDFGLARVAEDVKLTRTGFVSGTPAYMAPEQALGQEPDPRSDLFSLGAVLYEMSAGEPPFTGNSALAVLKQIAEATPRPIRERNPAIPDWLADTIDQLLAKQPADRIQTAAQLAELFEFQWALLKTTSEDVPTVCQIEERRRTVRNRWIAAAVGATFLLLGLLGGRYFFAGPGSPFAVFSSAEPTAVLQAQAGAVWSVAFDPAGDDVVMAVEDGSLRVWDVPTSRILSTRAAHRGTIWSTQFSPDGKLLASTGDDGLIKIWKSTSAELVHTFQHPNAVRSAVFAPDGRTLYAVDRDGGLRVWSLDSPRPVAETQQIGTIYAVALSSDGETVATAGSDKIVRLWNAKTLTQKIPLEGHEGPIYGLAFRRDGRRLASVGWDRTVRLWDADGGQLVRSWEAHRGDVWTVDFSPDGAKLATGGTDGAVKLWNAETGELLATFLGHQIAVHTVSFDRAGTRLASGGRDGSVRIWKIDP